MGKFHHRQIGQRVNQKQKAVLQYEDRPEGRVFRVVPDGMKVGLSGGEKFLVVNVNQLTKHKAQLYDENGIEKTEYVKLDTAISGEKLVAPSNMPEGVEMSFKNGKGLSNTVDYTLDELNKVRAEQGLHTVDAIQAATHHAYPAGSIRTELAPDGDINSHSPYALAEWNKRRRAAGMPEVDALIDDPLFAMDDLVHRQTAALGMTPKEAAAAEYAIKFAMLELMEWMDKNDDKYVLQKNECSRWHSVVEAFDESRGGKFKQGRYSVNVTSRPESKESRSYEGVQTFVVKHDWRAAFGDSLGEITEGELKLPFECCAFEFKVSGVYVVFTFTEDQRYLYVQAKNGVWFSYDDDTTNKERTSEKLWDYLLEQVKAICVMLDSEVASTSTVQAPYKLNKKRVDAGKTPLSDYHVIDLSVRHRGSARNQNPTPTGRHVRAHWRRGHWVHADKRPAADLHRHATAQRWVPHEDRWRTWKNWMIVGDPDLGFVEKEYKL